MTTYLAIICDPKRFSAKLQNYFAKKPHPDHPYHVAWWCDGFYYDMNTTWRRVPDAHYGRKYVRFFVPPVRIAPFHLEDMLGRRSYGYLDVLLYPLLRALNLPGTHCAEAINDDLWFHGYRTPWIPYGKPPSPADVLYWAISKLEEIGR